VKQALLVLPCIAILSFAQGSDKVTAPASSAAADVKMVPLSVDDIKTLLAKELIAQGKQVGLERLQNQIATAQKEMTEASADLQSTAKAIATRVCGAGGTIEQGAKPDELSCKPQAASTAPSKK
jgi:DNA polymerase III delta prime subunit